ncbi:MAG: aspartate/glutamate racemase family protein [Clostridia bacterium]|nr:aspartate/glutamate racemase family protein [Clostridia bacterium]
MKNILIIDSGVGAISIANEIRKIVNANLYVYIDNKNAPLGEKNEKVLKQIAYNILKRNIKKYKIDLVVLACNTLTVGTISFLRENFNILIVGTEPNVKIKDLPAIVFCTSFTYKNCKLINESKLDKIALPKLATLIDKNLQDLSILSDYFMRFYNKLKDYKAISLGCTHYTFIKEIINKIFPNIKIYENKFGVANRVKYLLENCKFNKVIFKGKRIFKRKGKGRIKLILSKQNSKFKMSLKNYLK